MKELGMCQLKAAVGGQGELLLKPQIRLQRNAVVFLPLSGDSLQSCRNSLPLLHLQDRLSYEGDVLHFTPVF